MQRENSIFQVHYEQYLAQVQELPLAEMAPRIGAIFADGRLRLPLFDRFFQISGAGIFGPDGNRPGYDVCVILSKYLLLFPKAPVAGDAWVSYRDFRDSRPLHNYFAGEVEQAVARHFAGSLDRLHRAGEAIGGYPPDLQVSFDLAMQFDALPGIPVVLLFNDAEDDFPAGATLLFPARTEAYLDAECIAMLGAHLVARLKRVAG